MLYLAYTDFPQCTSLFKNDYFIAIKHLNSCYTCCYKQTRIYDTTVSISIIVVKI